MLDQEKASSLNQFQNSTGEICCKSPNNFSIVYIHVYRGRIVYFLGDIEL